jgi:transketolase
MRTAFIKELAELARTNSGIFLVVADLGYSVVETYAHQYPDRYLNSGVAEQNTTGLAAGLASEGYHVFTYSIANFPTFRCAEQIRNDIAYHNLPVTVVAIGGGLAYGNLGYSHHAVQDYALLRTFPGMVIASPGDPAETRACLRSLVSTPRPSYLRLGKAGEPTIHDATPEVSEGGLVPVAGNVRAKKLLLTTGAALKLAHDALDAKHSSDWQLCSLPLWSEKSKSQVAKALNAYDVIVTAEDHLYAGGFGSYINEALNAANIQRSVRHIALSETVCGLVANQATLNDKGGLSVPSIHAAMDAFAS